MGASHAIQRGTGTIFREGDTRGTPRGVSNKANITFLSEASCAPLSSRTLHCALYNWRNLRHFTDGWINHLPKIPHTCSPARRPGVNQTCHHSARAEPAPLAITQAYEGAARARLSLVSVRAGAVWRAVTLPCRGPGCSLPPQSTCTELGMDVVNDGVSSSSCFFILVPCCSL